MQADNTLPMAQRRNYKNVFHALYRISSDEGILALWKGAGPTVVRAMALNMGMLASYDQSVELFRDNFHLSEAPTIVGKLCNIHVVRNYVKIKNTELNHFSWVQEGIENVCCLYRITTKMAF